MITLLLEMYVYYWHLLLQLGLKIQYNMYISQCYICYCYNTL